MTVVGIFLDGQRIGTVMKIMGEPAKRRWFAFGPNERKEGFPTRKEAIAALERWHAEPAAGTEDDND